MRQSNILIICFVIFVLAFLGYSLWQNKTPVIVTSKEKQDADMKMAEKFLEEGEAERSLPIIHKHKEEMEKNTPEGQKWLNLFVDATVHLNDYDQLLMIYQFNPESLKNNEKGALNLADLFLKENTPQEYEQIRDLWKKRETNLPAWSLLDADYLLQKGHKQQAYDLLKEKKWSGKWEDERLMRLILIKQNEDSNEALNLLNAEYTKDPRNPNIRILRAKIYESQNEIALAEQEFNTATNLEPSNIYLQDQLAEFYRRQKNYTRALTIWQRVLNQSANDQIWMKNQFWNLVAVPLINENNKNILSHSEEKGFQAYILNLKPGQFWNTPVFEKVPHNIEALSEYQAVYWLRLLQALKDHDETSALAMLQNNIFGNCSWAPLLELNLHRILNYRKTGSLNFEGDIPHADPLLQIIAQENIPTLYSVLEKLAQQQANHGDAFIFPGDMQSLLINQEIFAVAFLSEGWLEAGLQLHPLGLLSADFPEWVPMLYINSLRKQRGNPSALQFAEQQKLTPSLAIYKAEIEMADGKTEQASKTLESLSKDPSDEGAKATWLIALIEMQKGNYQQAQEAIASHPRLSQSIHGQEALGRIASLQGNPNEAIQIYEKIVDQSNEAKSYLARVAFQQKNWTQARELTEDLLRSLPGNIQLQENLKKIIVNERQQKNLAEK